MPNVRIRHLHQRPRVYRLLHLRGGRVLDGTRGECVRPVRDGKFPVGAGVHWLLRLPGGQLHERLGGDDLFHVRRGHVLDDPGRERVRPVRAGQFPVFPGFHGLLRLPGGVVRAGEREQRVPPVRDGFVPELQQRHDVLVLPCWDVGKPDQSDFTRRRMPKLLPQRHVGHDDRAVLAERGVRAVLRGRNGVEHLAARPKQ